MIESGAVIEFNRKKQFKHIRPLGVGGTGDTHLFEDETTDMHFAFKKYSPKDANYIEENYRRFVEEIKILFRISHPNIVKVYNYYLYPVHKLGYLQMEYIDGVTISDFQPSIWGGKEWADIFTDVISAFEYLETNNILHRDIRPANIMIDKNENVKVIDFGFGKKLESKDQDGKSVFLNWPVTQLPEEIVVDGVYNHRTEIYFVGKLFSNIVSKESSDFKFGYIIEKMIKIDPRERYSTFNEIVVEISKGVLGEINFNSKEKEVYIKFANALSLHITKYKAKYDPVNDLNISISKLAILIRNSSLESYIQDNSQLIRCFINGGFTYNSKIDIEFSTVVEFYQLLQRLVPNKQKIVLDNIYTRLAKIKIDVIDDDDLPF
jgi:serine/threonine protein kinase